MNLKLTILIALIKVKIIKNAFIPANITLASQAIKAGFIRGHITAFTTLINDKTIH